MIEINRDKCVGCGQCVQICPFTVLYMEEGKAKASDKMCIKCMHCGSICPKEAITFGGAVTVTGEKPICFDENTAEIIKGAIYSRRSYRKFTTDEVPDEIIEESLNVAMWAPSAKNQHPVKWIVLKSEEAKNKIMDMILDFCRDNSVNPEIISEYKNGNNPVMGENAALIFAYCDEKALNPSQDTAIALSSAELIFQSRGIGTCWGGYLTRFSNNVPGILELLGVTDGHKVFGTLMIGYPNQKKYNAIPERFNKNEIICIK